VNATEAKRFLEQFELSKAEVARLKLAVPELFPAWQMLKAAEEEFAQAKERLELAQKRWEKA
jgi:hypothetical protein